MSRSRVDYQPLESSLQDTPPYSRHSGDHSNGQESSLEELPRDQNIHKEYSGKEPHHDDQYVDDEEEEHSHRDGDSEAQELVRPSERGRDFIDHHRPSLGTDNGDEEEEKLSSKDAAAAWAIRMQAFFCAALLGISSHFTLHMTGPLKDVLKESMGISNTQFSLLQSSLTLFPTLMPLIGGLLVERYGTGPSSIVFTTIVIAGQSIVILGCWTHSVKVMIAGYCLFGLGAAPITIIQETMWVRYFKKNGLALVLALGLTSGKLSGFIALATSVPLTTLEPFGFVTPFVVSLVISLFAWSMNLIFLMLLRKPKEGTDTLTKITILLKAKQTNLGWREVYGFSTMFWTMLTISFLVGASWNPFMHQSSNIVKHRYGMTDEQAGWEASVILAVPLLIYPFLGTFIDHNGKRAWLLLVTAGLLVATHLILLIPFSVVPIPPTIPMLLFAFSLSLGTLSIVTSMPVLTKHVPTGLGLHRSIDNIGATLIGTISGMLQDSAGTDIEGNSNTESFFDRLYHTFFPVEEDKALQESEDVRLLGMFLMVAIVAFVACAVFVWGDYHWTDGEGGKTGLVNGVYGKRNQSSASNHRSSRSRRRHGTRGRRSHEVLEAMTLEPIFELQDEPDAEEVSMTELGSNSARFHSDANPAIELRDQHGLRIPQQDQDESTDRLQMRQERARGVDWNGRRSDAEESSGSEESDGDSDSVEDRYGVQIETGEDEIPQDGEVARIHLQCRQQQQQQQQQHEK
ncbi:hypothetical protein BGZ83_011909 [Gryganskiella cystojenkinii]|nr:hypothetical protein BGZ83_011909 [Gryganskiella cystojenkinii]